MAAADQSRAALDGRNSVAVVVVNWRRAQLTLECLAALRSTVDAAWHLYIVDNASGDGSVEALSGLGADVTLIVADRNTGWSGGNNLGVEAALAAGHDAIFLLNNDAVVAADTIARLVAAAAAAGAACPVLGPLHLTMAGDAYTFVGADVDARTGLPQQRPVEVDPARLPALIETSFIKGAGIFACRRHFDEIGYFDDDFYLNYDETDWCFRARRLGFANLLVRDALIRHDGSATIGGNRSPLQVYFMARNKLLFAERHASVRQRLEVWRDTYRWVRNLYPGAGRLWFARFLVEPRGLYAASRLAVGDHLRRRFGDCPPVVREMAELP